MRGLARPLVAVGWLLGAAGLSAAEVSPPVRVDGSSITCGTFRVVHSKVLDEDRILRVRLPEGYDKGDRKYPVLYKLDGQQPVFLETAAAVEYLVDMSDKVPDQIVVGIENGDRLRDMDPERGAESFGRFITTELVPFVEARYRTSGFRILAGQSLSALFALDLFLRQPASFNAYILSSPGLYKESLVPQLERELRALAERAKPGQRKIFVAFGKHDTYDPDGSITARSIRFLDSVRTAAAPGVVLKTATYEDEGHVPFPSVYDGLRWIYSKEGAP